MKVSLLCAGLMAVSAFGAPPTIGDARKFLDDAEAKLFDLSGESQRAAWVQSTYITDDTETLAAIANERAIAATVVLAKESTASNHEDVRQQSPDALADSNPFPVEGFSKAAAFCRADDAPPRHGRSRVHRFQLRAAGRSTGP